MASDLSTLMARLRSQLQEYHDGGPQDPETVTDGSLIADAVTWRIQEAAEGGMDLEEAMGQSSAYTDFDLEGFMATYPDTFADLYSDA